MTPTTRGTATVRGRGDIRPVDAEALVDYYRVVAARTDDLLATITEDELDRVVDERWDPPVTLGVRLISIADDDIQHAGQAKYLRGLLAGRSFVAPTLRPARHVHGSCWRYWLSHAACSVW